VAQAEGETKNKSGTTGGHPRNDMNTPETPHTTAPAGPYAYHFCRCHICGTVAQATPNFDFYSTPTSDLLQCERCFFDHLADKGVMRLPDIAL